MKVLIVIFLLSWTSSSAQELLISSDTCQVQALSVFQVIAYKKKEILQIIKQEQRKRDGKSFAVFFDLTKHEFFVPSKDLNVAETIEFFEKKLSNKFQQAFLRTRSSDIGYIKSLLADSIQCQDLAAWPEIVGNKIYYELKHSPKYKEWCFQVYQLEGHWASLKFLNEIPYNRFLRFGTIGIDPNVDTVTLYVPNSIQKISGFIAPDDGSITNWKSFSR